MQAEQQRNADQNSFHEEVLVLLAIASARLRTHERWRAPLRARIPVFTGARFETKSGYANWLPNDNNGVRMRALKTRFVRLFKMADRQKDKPKDEAPPNISLSRLRNIERLRNAGLEMGNPVHFYVKFFFIGLDQPLVYEVSEAEWKRVTDCFYQYNEDPPGSFVEFSDIKDRIVVHVSPEYVSLYQALFEAGRVESTPRPGADVNRVNIYLSGRSKPLEIDYMEDADVADLNEDLNFADSTELQFVSFVDGDGEDNSIRVDHIIVIETPDYEMSDEDADGEGSSTTRPAKIE